MTGAYQVKVPVPDGALPGTVLSVPVKGGMEKLQIRVPENCGPGSLLVLIQAEGSQEWQLEVAKDPEVSVRDHAAQPQEQPRQDSTGHIPNSPFEVMPRADNVRLETTAGPIDILVRHDWSPHGARRFMELVSHGDLVDLAFYRAIQGCIVQFGLPPKRTWTPIPDDPPSGVPFLLGAVSFAAVGPNSRRSTLFICIGDMSHCLGDKPWETPIGAVEEASLDVLERINTIYGDIVEFGGVGPDTRRIQAEGNAYLMKNFPGLSYVNSARCDPNGGEATQPNVREAAQQATASALEAQRLAMEATSTADREEMLHAVRRAREAANAAEAAAQAAEAAQSANWGGCSGRITPPVAADELLQCHLQQQHVQEPHANVQELHQASLQDMRYVQQQLPHTLPEQQHPNVYDPQQLQQQVPHSHVQHTAQLQQHLQWQHVQQPVQLHHPHAHLPELRPVQQPVQLQHQHPHLQELPPMHLPPQLQQQHPQMQELHPVQLPPQSHQHPQRQELQPMPMQLPAQFEQRPPHLHELQPMQLPPPFQQHPHLQELQPMQPHLHHGPEQHVALQPYWPPVQGGMTPWPMGQVPQREAAGTLLGAHAFSPFKAMEVAVKGHHMQMDLT